MNLPNALTLLRIFIVPVLIVVLLTRSPNVELGGFPMHFEFWGVLILLIAAATDWADGYFARRRAQVTTLGILLDPIADKLLICAAFISLVDMHLAKAWMVVIIIGRELVILGLRNIASAEGFTIAASTLGKTKDGVAGLCRGGADLWRQASFVADVGTGAALACGDQRGGFRRTILLQVLESTGRPGQAAA